MPDQSVIVQKISWQDLCPWTIIFKTLPVATSVTVIALALLGVLLTPMGWMLSETLFVHQEQRTNVSLMDTVEVNNSPYRSVFAIAPETTGDLQIWETRVRGPKLVFEQLVSPFRMLFHGSLGGWEFCYFLFGSLWSLLVWSFLGLAIARVCLLRLTRNEHSGLDDGFDFAIDNWMTAMGAVGIPLLGVAALCIPAFLIGLLMGLDIGVLLVGIFWFVVLAIAGLMALLLLGSLFGWPLMISSVAAESQNSFDAMTRAFAYTFQRPIHYLFYLLLSILFGGFCWLVVAALTDGVLHLAYWSTSWGTDLIDPNRIELIQDGVPEASSAANVTDESTTGLDTSWSFDTGRGIIGLWNSVARTVAAAFIYGLFWCLAAAIYLLLRRDVDETAMDEIFLVDEKRTYELPPLKSDADGIPQVQAPVPADENPDEPE